MNDHELAMAWFRAICKAEWIDPCLEDLWAVSTTISVLAGMGGEWALALGKVMTRPSWILTVPSSCIAGPRSLIPYTSSVSLVVSVTVLSQIASSLETRWRNEMEVVVRLVLP